MFDKLKEVVPYELVMLVPNAELPFELHKVASDIRRTFDCTRK